MTARFLTELAHHLVAERGHSTEDAHGFISSYPQIIVKGILSGNIRATALALEMAHRDLQADAGDAQD